MTNTDFSFEDWCNIVCNHLLDRTGFDLVDRESVREDYDNGINAMDVVQDIIDHG